MNIKQNLRQLCADKQMVKIDRSPITDDRSDGYLVGIGKQFALLHSLNPDMFLDGYEVVPIEDVRGYLKITDRDYCYERALKARKMSPKPHPKIKLDDFPSLLKSANSQYPLITIHTERINDSFCNIGRIKDITNESVTLEEISTLASWDWIREHKFSDITKVEFGRSYESVLWLIYCQENGTRKELAEARKADLFYPTKSRKA